MSKKTKNNPFKKAVKATPDIAIGFQDGLKALGNYSNKVIVSIKSDLQGSVDIDTNTASLYPNENRWDYALAYNGKVFFVEVHSAHTKEVSVVLKKLQWLKNWLRTNAPGIQKLQAAQAFHWIQSGKFAVLKTSSQYRTAAQAGLLPKPNLTLE